MKKLSIVMLWMMAAPLVFAQGGGQGSVFDQLDANRDGQISTSEAEISRALLEQFTALDGNGDGMLSPEEFAAFDSGS